MDKIIQEFIEGLSFKDFQTKEPYQFLYAHKENPFEAEQIKVALERRAKEVGFKGFKTLNNKYAASLKADKIAGSSIFNVTQFTGQPLVLKCGDWIAKDKEIFRYKSNGSKELACSNPVMPVARYVDVESKKYKLCLAYRSPDINASWRKVVVDMMTVSNTREIVKLAENGIYVNSSTASALMDFIRDVNVANYSTIPEYHSVSKLGYLENLGFVPYRDDLKFGGDSDYLPVYEAVRPCGSFEEWCKIASECRQQSVPAKILLAASFASPLISFLNLLSFFVHCWGIESGTGKTVALKLASSVWGNPTSGNFLWNFNATDVGLEKMAAFLNHLPYCLDELQVSKDGNGQAKINVYLLAEGSGRTRGTKHGGVEMLTKWKNCFLSTGETPLTALVKGAGAVNRVIDIECAVGEKVISDGKRVANKVEENYGYAGRVFVEKLYGSEEVKREIRNTFNCLWQEILEHHVTEKQAMAGAAILVADHFATRWIFKDGNDLSVEELVPYLAKDESVCLGEKAYELLCAWVASNENHFHDDKNSPYKETYGVREGSKVYIIHSVFSRKLEENGFNERAILGYLSKCGLIETRGTKGCCKSKRINGISSQCIVMHLPDEECGGVGPVSN